MKIGVISDTHISTGGFRKIASKMIQKVSEDILSLEKILTPYFKDCNFIFHAGDIVDLAVLEMLKKFAEVFAVAGNMDPYEVQKICPAKRVIELSGLKFGLIHGSGSPDDLPKRVRMEFSKERLHSIVFGHSHQAYNKFEEGILMFNPGSATDRRFAPYRSIGILHLEDKIRGEIIKL